ncbi:MAG: TetR family transcriptional regulator [Chloroflexota bacterium]
MAEVALERGLRGATISLVAKRAGVSRTTLSDRFATLEECFLELIDWMLQQATPLVVEAFEREPSWHEGVLAGLEQLLTFFDKRPVRTQVCLLESMALPPVVLQPRAQLLGQMGLYVDQRARRELSLERQPPAAMSEVAIGSVLVLVRRRLLIGGAPPFVALLGPLAEVIVGLYLGPSAAARAASTGCERAQALLDERPAVPKRRQVDEVPKLLRRANASRMRMCVRYLAEHPGSSNTEVGVGVGISHPGQVSILLGRLLEAGLLEKEEGGAGRPNAWDLSPFGTEVARALERWSGSSLQPA